MPDLKYPRKLRDSLFWTSRNCTGPPPRWSSSCVAKMAAAPLSSCEHSSPIWRNHQNKDEEGIWGAKREANCKQKLFKTWEHAGSISRSSTLPKVIINRESSHSITTSELPGEVEVFNATAASPCLFFITRFQFHLSIYNRSHATDTRVEPHNSLFTLTNGS